MVIFPLIVIVFSALIARKITNTWLSPSSFFSVCWVFFLIVPLVFASDYKIDLLGIWFIAIFTMSLVTGSVVAYYPFVITKKI